MNTTDVMDVDSAEDTADQPVTLAFWVDKIRERQADVDRLAQELKAAQDALNDLLLHQVPEVMEEAHLTARAVQGGRRLCRFPAQFWEEAGDLGLLPGSQRGQTGAVGRIPQQGAHGFQQGAESQPAFAREAVGQGDHGAALLLQLPGRRDHDRVVLRSIACV